MQLSLAPLALLFSVAAAAQTTSYSLISTTSACAAQPVLEACIASTSAIVQSCASTDYSCLCQKWTDVETCFLQCPNDSRYAATLSYRTTFCNNAALYPTTTSSAISRAVSSAFSAATTASTTAGAASGSSGAVKVSSSTASGSQASAAAASTTAKSGAKGREVVNGGVVVGLFGLMGALL